MDLLSALVECTASGDTVQKNGHELVNFKHVRVPTRREEPVATSRLHTPCERDQRLPLSTRCSSSTCHDLVQNSFSLPLSSAGKFTSGCLLAISP